MALADFNGDGIIDLATGNSTSDTLSGDRLAGNFEFFNVRLTNPVNAFVADAEALGIIVDAATSAAQKGTPARRRSTSP